MGVAFAKASLMPTALLQDGALHGMRVESSRWNSSCSAASASPTSAPESRATAGAGPPRPPRRYEEAGQEVEQAGEEHHREELEDGEHRRANLASAAHVRPTKQPDVAAQPRRPPIHWLRFSPEGSRSGQGDAGSAAWWPESGAGRRGRHHRERRARHDDEGDKCLAAAFLAAPAWTSTSLLGRRQRERNG
ncbi:unnamed protein product [Urochloa humidicola]